MQSDISWHPSIGTKSNKRANELSMRAGNYYECARVTHAMPPHKLSFRTTFLLAFCIVVCSVIDLLSQLLFPSFYSRHSIIISWLRGHSMVEWPLSMDAKKRGRHKKRPPFGSSNRIRPSKLAEIPSLRAAGVSLHLFLCAAVGAIIKKHTSRLFN